MFSTLAMLSEHVQIAYYRANVYLLAEDTDPNAPPPAKPSNPLSAVVSWAGDNVPQVIGLAVALVIVVVGFKKDSGKAVKWIGLGIFALVFATKPTAFGDLGGRIVDSF